MTPINVLKFPAALDNSALNLYKKCPYAFYVDQILRLRHAGDSIHLVAGKAYATGHEVARKAIQRKVPLDEAMALGLTALTKEYGDFPCPERYEAKSLDRMSDALVAYYLEAYDHTWEQIEYSFALPLPINHPETGDPVLYTGKFDGLVIYGGRHWIYDDKTTGSLGNQFVQKWKSDPQMLGYTWAAHQGNHDVAGAIVVGCGLQKTKTTFLRTITPYPKYMLDRWYRETCELVSQIVKAYQTESWERHFGDSCNSYGQCANIEVCTSPNPTLDLQHYVPNTWNPLDRL